MKCYIFLYNCVELILYESRIQFVRHQESSLVFFSDAFEFCHKSRYSFSYIQVVFNIVYSFCPENLSEVLNTEQLKVEQPQDKTRLEKISNLPFYPNQKDRKGSNRELTWLSWLR